MTYPAEHKSYKPRSLVDGFVDRLAAQEFRNLPDRDTASQRIGTELAAACRRSDLAVMLATLLRIDGIAAGEERLNSTADSVPIKRVKENPHPRG